jgi:hypothetical protein
MTEFHNAPIGWDDAEIKRRVDAAMSAFDTEVAQWPALEWQKVPEVYGMARNRLPKLVELNAPDFIIANEIKLVQQRIAALQKIRLGASVH